MGECRQHRWIYTKAGKIEPCRACGAPYEPPVLTDKELEGIEAELEDIFADRYETRSHDRV